MAEKKLAARPSHYRYGRSCAGHPRTSRSCAGGRHRAGHDDRRGRFALPDASPDAYGAWPNRPGFCLLWHGKTRIAVPSLAMTQGKLLSTIRLILIRVGEARQGGNRADLHNVVGIHAARRLSSGMIASKALTSSSIIASVCSGPGVKRNRSSPRDTVGELIGVAYMPNSFSTR